MNARTKFSFFVLLFALVIAAFALPAFAQEVSPSISTTVAVNVRSGPGTEYTIRGVLFDSAPAIGRNDFAADRICLGRDSDLNMWIRIDFKGLDGWVARCAVNFTGSIASLPVASPSNPLLVANMEPMTENVLRTEINALAPDGAYVVGYTRARVNIRTAPSLSADVRDIAAPVEDFFVTGRTADNRWVEVTYGDKSGWVARFLMLLPADWDRNIPVK